MVFYVLINYVIYNLVQLATYQLLYNIFTNPEGWYLVTYTSYANSEAGEVVTANVANFMTNGFIYNLFGLVIAVIGGIVLRSQEAFGNVAEKLLEDRRLAEVDTIQQRVKRFMFPLFLYFHNDEPDPQSHEVVTETSYTDCQKRYAQLRNEYIGRQTNAEDSTLMATFFDTCVVGNYSRVEELFDYVESLLDAGHKIIITISGYASPLARSDYNHNLSRRRIVAFINMVRAWRGGVFEDALSEGRLFLDQKPHGAVEPTTESTSKDPVYGLPAALARRIEILGCEIR